eukprot:scaffold18588_cov79-Cyclotella_meneghiniana.AAC.6
MPPKNKYWKDHEARFVANVVQETAALPTRKRKKNYPKGASPPQSESDGEEDTQKTPAPTSKKPKNPKQKKKKPKSSSGPETQPPPLPSLPPNPTNTKDSPSDSAGGDEVRPSGVDGDGENLFDDDPVEFDPISTRGPFDSDAEDDSRGEVTLLTPSESDVGNLATEPTPDTSVTTAAKSDASNCVTLPTPDASVAASRSRNSKDVTATGSTGKSKPPATKRSAAPSKFTIKSKKKKPTAPKRKQKRTEWAVAATSHPDVMSKQLELMEGGWEACCM